MVLQRSFAVPKMCLARDTTVRYAGVTPFQLRPMTDGPRRVHRATATRRWSLLLFVLLACVCRTTAESQRRDVRAATRVGGPRIAIVLSGGGAKGIAHIGVLQVLEEEGISSQIVTGASMGALIGGLYAIGYSPAALDSVARHLDWVSYFSDAGASERRGHCPLQRRG
jgi:Patatin-like phospholipase